MLATRDWADAQELSAGTSSVHAMATDHTALTDLERQILDLERGWWKYAGAKETHVRDHFGISATRYYLILNRLLDRPAAEAHDPLVVRRLRRLRTARAAHRTIRTLTN